MHASVFKQTQVDRGASRSKSGSSSSSPPFPPFSLGKLKHAEKEGYHYPNKHGLGQGPNPIFNALDTFFFAVADIITHLKDPIILPSRNGGVEPPNDSSDIRDEGPSVAVPSSDDGEHRFDPKFVHWRHVCDVCNVTPIVRYRYHATNIPNFDLCQSCEMACELLDVEFELAQHGELVVIIVLVPPVFSCEPFYF